MSTSKGKNKSQIENGMLHVVPNLDEISLVDLDFKIIQTQREYDLYEFHNWDF